MEIKQEVLKQMYSISYKNISSQTDKLRALIKGDEYANNIIKVRNMSKFKLVKFIAKLEDKESVQLGYNIAHSSSSKMYRMLDVKIQQDIELINYARNRLYATN